MKLLHLAAGRKHAVWAVCDEGGACPVLDVFMQVNEEHPDLAESMAALLFEEVADKGPPLDDPRRAKRLYKDFLFELKASKQVGGGERLGFRVAFFFDGVRRVICANAFYKSTSTPPEALRSALDAYHQYQASRDRGELHFEQVGS